ncbi:MAG: CUAEP/CCAEP-tail radical SAM protein, partial [Thiohalobacteraceae bacterium]
FITSAVESIDDQVLGYLDKGHTRADFVRAVEAVRAAGIDLAPTFMPFTPWTRLEGYVELLQQLITLRLVESVPPIQLSIRLLVPDGSYLLELEGFRALLAEFDPVMLGHRWVHADARVDALQQQVQRWVADADKQGLSRRETFTGIWELAHAALDRTPPALPADLGRPIAAMSEPWYCCAEPTDQQLQGF